MSGDIVAAMKLSEPAAMNVRFQVFYAFVEMQEEAATQKSSGWRTADQLIDHMVGHLEGEGADPEVKPNALTRPFLAVYRKRLFRQVMPDILQSMIEDGAIEVTADATYDEHVRSRRRELYPGLVYRLTPKGEPDAPLIPHGGPKTYEEA